MLPHLPPGITAVIAVARSGLLPGVIFATALHVPLFAISPIRRVLTEVGNGYRLGQAGRAALNGPCIIVDDTASYGGTMQTVLHAAAGQIDLRKAYTAAIYADPDAAKKFDFVGRIYPQPHYLEWNFVNTFWARDMAYDFDGILCEDPAFFDTDPRYAAFIAEAHPLYLPKLFPPVVLSARCETARAASTEWLARHGVRPRRMILWEGRPDDRWAAPDTVAAWKADQLRRLHEAESIAIYAESDPRQAAAIAERSGLPVICPAAQRVYNQHLHRFHQDAG